MLKRNGIFALLVLFAAVSASAEPYETLSIKLSKIARTTGYKRLAVMPLQPVTGSSTQSGEIIAERLISHLSFHKGIEIVERTLLDQVLKEQGLGYKGLIRPEQAKAVGRVLGVDAIVTGTYLKLRHGQLEIHARIIDTETARVLGAATARVRKEWEEGLQFASANVWDTPPPALVGFERPTLAKLSDLRDSLSDITACDNWEKRVATTQKASLEARARYWAAKLQDPTFHTSTLTRNPGSDIRDLGLRRKFYNRTEELYQQGVAQGISMREKEHLDAADRHIQRVLEECYY